MTHYLLDIDRTSLEFSIRHLVRRARGRFTNFAGVIDLDPFDVTRSRITMAIDAGSIVSDEGEPAASFFDLERYPLIELASKSVQKDGYNLRVVAALTLNGVTRDVVLDMKPVVSFGGPVRPERVAFLASMSIDRREFGLSGSPFIVGDKVEINLDIHATHADARAAA